MHGGLKNVDKVKTAMNRPIDIDKLRGSGL